MKKNVQIVYEFAGFTAIIWIDQWRRQSYITMKNLLIWHKPHIWFMKIHGSVIFYQHTNINRTKQYFEHKKVIEIISNWFMFDNTVQSTAMLRNIIQYPICLLVFTLKTYIKWIKANFSHKSMVWYLKFEKKKSLHCMRICGWNVCCTSEEHGKSLE